MSLENVAPRARPLRFPLPRIAARSDSSPGPPADVRSAADLPDRLFVGDLVPGSFELRPDGWRARYEDAEPETSADLEFLGGEKPLLRVSVAFRGNHGLVSQTPACSFGDLARAAIVLPEPWVEGLRERLAVFAVEMLRAPSGPGFVATFPDGWLMKLLVPLPLRELSRVVAFHRCVEADAQRRTAVDVSLLPWWSCIEYAVGRSPVAEESPDAVAARDAEAWGLPQPEAPVFVDHPGGPRVLRLMRHHLNLDVSTSLRDFERVVRALVATGLVALDGGDRAPERRAFVARAPLLDGGRRIELYAEDRSRRVVHLPPDAADCSDATVATGRSADVDACLDEVARRLAPQRDGS